MDKSFFQDSIISGGKAAADQEAIDRKVSLLPYMYIDVLSMHFGPRKMSDSQIAEILNGDVHTHLNEELVAGMFSDAMAMVDHKLESFESFDFRLSAEQQKKHRSLSWESVISIRNIIRNSNDYQDREDLAADLKEKYFEGDIVTAPGIEDLYYVEPNSIQWRGAESVPEAFTLQEIEDVREFAEIILVILDEIGVCLISDAPKRGKVEPQDIYRYAYLKDTFAKRIACENPRKLIEES